jgi:uncharacterized membrane protein YidH (DUF202 family)
MVFVSSFFFSSFLGIGVPVALKFFFFVFQFAEHVEVVVQKAASPQMPRNSADVVVLKKSEYVSLTQSIEVLLKLVHDARTRKPPLDPLMKLEVKTIEPRTHLANERTFLNWISTLIQLFFLGMALATVFRGTLYAVVTGAFFACCAILAAVYAAIAFEFRTRGNFYSDKWGPLVLTIAIVVAMAISLILFLSMGDS